MKQAVEELVKTLLVVYQGNNIVALADGSGIASY
jgi:hypothetical protein